MVFFNQSMLSDPVLQSELCQYLDGLHFDFIHRSMRRKKRQRKYIQDS